MKMEDALEAVRNDRVEFVTMRPPGSTFVILERRVVVTGPAELVELAATGDVRVLEQLIELLKEPDRAWAAEVLLATMTHREEKLVDTFAAALDDWFDSLGKTAHERWSAWLNRTKENLVWNSEEKFFEEKVKDASGLE
jgi:hypothetical protein